MLFHYCPYQLRNSLCDSPPYVSINIDSLRSTVCIQVDHILVYFQERITCCLGNNRIGRLTTFGRYLKSIYQIVYISVFRNTGEYDTESKGSCCTRVVGNNSAVVGSSACCLIGGWYFQRQRMRLVWS
nr:MAG TPA: hypothetical protein [Caudoviricetes sp.]